MNIIRGKYVYMYVIFTCAFEDVLCRQQPILLLSVQVLAVHDEPGFPGANFYCCGILHIAL